MANHYARVLRWFFSAIVAPLATFFLTLPIITASIFTRSDRLGFVISRIWAWILSKAMGLTFSVYGADRIAPGQSYIIAPNHQGYADILALLRTMPLSFRWVLKKELLRIPFFGWALARMGTVSVDRADRRRAVQSLNRARCKFSDGWSVLIFPEGTRTPDGNLQPFKKGAFMLAVHTGIPILPVTINGAFRVMPRKTLLFRPGHVTVTIGAPIVTASLSDQDIPTVMEKTWEAIQENLVPNYDPTRPETIQSV